MSARASIRSVATRLPVIGRVIVERAQFAAERDAAVTERDRLRALVEAAGVPTPIPTMGGAVVWVPPGHFYSPNAPLDEIRERDAAIFGRDRALPWLDLGLDRQRALVRRLATCYPDIPFPESADAGFRYHFDNPAYSWSDAIMYHCLLRTIRPRRVIEVGSGFSSALAFDTNDLFLDNSVEITCIEPYTELLHSLMRSDSDCRIIESGVQDVPLEVFESLDSGDVLFIDSTHVSRVGSDVNYLYFEVLPRLRPGVWVHIHDIFDGFEYPADWVYEGRAWTELYLLRALLMGNRHLEVQLMNTYLSRVDREWFEATMPNCLRNPGGSIWLRVVGDDATDR